MAKKLEFIFYVERQADQPVVVYAAPVISGRMTTFDRDGNRLPKSGYMDNRHAYGFYVDYLDDQPVLKKALIWLKHLVSQPRLTRAEALKASPALIGLVEKELGF